MLGRVIQRVQGATGFLEPGIKLERFPIRNDGIGNMLSTLLQRSELEVGVRRRSRRSRARELLDLFFHRQLAKIVEGDVA